jgi:hypothetical protein
MLQAFLAGNDAALGCKLSPGSVNAGKEKRRITCTDEIS